ncbi:uncharacterized protein LOC135844087 [Planococcus citri]|uniref:uncharacterized protein LOC135844087 n=1 Tax=Planococcus citri TaxID=170843 RepID=UPI0031F99BD0
MNFLICGFIYCLFSTNINAKSGLSQDITSSSSRSRVVVFDIDCTLCKPQVILDQLENAKKYHPECPIFFWNNVSHVFLPYLQVLFDYLIEHDVRIVFFSFGDKERNVLVISQLLTSFWGEVKYEALKTKGQFDIFSMEDTREGIHESEYEFVKDLKVVLKGPETLSDAILVEDYRGYVAFDQKPYLQIMDLTFWYIREENERERAEWLYSSYWKRNSPNYHLNSVYFMIGIFKTYFENEKYKILPFRESLNEILPEKKYYQDFFETHSFAYDMFDLGLSEVQKRVPNATFYGLRHPKVGSYTSIP